MAPWNSFFQVLVLLKVLKVVSPTWMDLWVTKCGHFCVHSWCCQNWNRVLFWVSDLLFRKSLQICQYRNCEKVVFYFHFFVAKYIYHLLVAKFDKPRVLENGCLVIFIEACLDIFLKSTKFWFLHHFVV